MPVTPHTNGVRLAVRLTPKAAKNHFGPIVKSPVAQSADGTAYLKAYVTTVPEDGKANKTLIRMLAKACKLAAGQISVASGATNRNKLLLIEGDSQDLTLKLEQLIKGNMS